jgi:hypothetical protein
MIKEAVWGLLSLTSQNRFPERGKGAARDWVRMRQRPACRQEVREELGHDGHARVDALAISPLAAGARATFGDTFRECADTITPVAWRPFGTGT